MGLVRNLALEKFSGIHRMTPAKTLSNRGEGAKLALPCSQIELMNILNITVGPSSSNWWKQRHRPALEHWAELPKSSWRVGGMRIWAKRSRPWWVHPLRQCTWANGSSPSPAGLWRNKHRRKQVPLNVIDCCMAGIEWGATGIAPGFITTACSGFLETYSLWMDTLLNLDIVGRDFGPSPKQCALLSLRCG